MTFLRRLYLDWQITRDIKRNITPARKSKQESARKGQSTYWSNAGKRARKVFEGVGG